MPCYLFCCMASGRQLKTNRLNAVKSTGPKTPEGKAISSQNRRTHGILSRAIVIEGENAGRFKEVHEALIAEFEPRTPVEHILVENLAVARWRTMRIWLLENAAVSHEIRRQTGLNEAENRPTRAALAYRALTDETRWLDVFNRYEARFDRQFSRSLQRLNELRASRQTQLLPEEAA